MATPSNQAAVLINGLELPMYDFDSGGQTRATMVNDARNVSGYFIGGRTRPDIVKLELSWSKLYPSEWRRILQYFNSNFVGDVTYFDDLSGTFVTKKMYVSDRSRKGVRVKQNGTIYCYKDCKLNLIEK